MHIFLLFYKCATFSNVSRQLHYMIWSFVKISHEFLKLKWNCYVFVYFSYALHFLSFTHLLCTCMNYWSWNGVLVKLPIFFLLHTCYIFVSFGYAPHFFSFTLVMHFYELLKLKWSFSYAPHFYSLTHNYGELWS